jgi:murein DD-endopeptidase MepM/ murein hydrolase activator NlpD
MVPCNWDGSAVLSTRIRDLDLKPRSSSSRSGLRLKRLHWAALILAGLIGGAFLLSLQNNHAAAVSQSAGNHKELPLELPESAATAVVEGTDAQQLAADAAHTPTADGAPSATAEEDRHRWRRVHVRPGDTLAGIFDKVGLSAKTLYRVLHAGEAAQALNRIFPNEQISFLIEDGELHALRYAVDESVTLHIERGAQGYQTSLVAHPLEQRLAHASATIDSSLYTAGKAAGLSDGLIMQLASIFGWDIDFALDIRAGDRFVIVYEEMYRNGEKVRDGGIVAAEFISSGRSYRAVAFTDDDGNREFYSPDGKSMRKAFLRSPVDFRRISSGFNPNRLHPKLGVRRPHRGTDYAAATGTPIHAAGDGKIVHRDWKGGYGRTIVIQHGSKYSTLYAHMSGYAKGLSTGSRVRQGQTIGYVGSSGLVTGPHLHYEFLVNGVHRNPVTVPLPEAQPIAKRLMPDFLKQTAPLVAQLDVLSRTELALQQKPQE